MKTLRSTLLAAVMLPLMGGLATAFDIPDDVFKLSDLEKAKEAALEEEAGITFIYTNAALRPS